MIIDFNDIKVGDNIRVTHTGQVTICHGGSVAIDGAWYIKSDNAVFEKMSPSWPTEIGSIATVEYDGVPAEPAVLTGNGWCWLKSGGSFAYDPLKNSKYKIISVDRIGI